MVVENIFSTLMKLYKSQQRADRKAATGESEDRSLMATLRELKSKKFKGIDSFDERTRLLLLSELDAVTEHDYAATPEELSSTWWDEDEEFPGGHSLWKHGFASLIEYLSHGINVILNARVVRISHCETKVSIQLENGHCYEADHCICTIPLGVLKRDHPTLFDPPLPESKLRSISRLGVGAMEKVALRFEDCFWEGSPQSRDALHCIYRIPTTEGRRHSGAMEAPYFVSLKPVTSSNTLVAYYVTDGARQLVTLEAAERVRHTLQLLCTMFGPLESRSLEEKLLEAKCSSWTLDEQSLGAYSFNAVGSSRRDRLTLASPLGALHFAGEGTCETFPSTVHGALLSGRRAAAEVVGKQIGAGWIFVADGIKHGWKLL
eukprot:s419_g1.t1